MIPLVPVLLLLLIVALIEELLTRGHDLFAWVVVFACIALLWGRLG